MTIDDTRSEKEPAGADEAARQAAVDSLGLLDTPPEERFDRITRLSAQIFGVPTALVTLIDRDRQFHKSRQGFGPPQIPRQDSFCTVAIGQPGVFVVEDASADPRFRHSPLVTGPQHARFYAGCPLTGRDGQRVGALCVVDTEPRTFTGKQCQILENLASMVEAELMIREEMDRAEEVQSQLLPQTKPDMAGLDFAAACRPSRNVSGDFYDWYCLADQLTITLADVMGKGLPASIIAATLRGILRSETMRSGMTAAFPATHHALTEDLDATGMLVTCFHSRLATDGMLRYVDAGHGLAVIARRSGTLDRLPVRGLPLGVSADSTWRIGYERLDLGDTLVVFSDGLLEAYRDIGETLAAVLAAAGEESAEAVVDRLLAWTRAGRHPDDVTVVVARRPGWIDGH